MRIASPVVENARWLAAVKRMIDQSGTPWRLHERVAPASPEEAVRIVDTFVTLGADHIKVRNWPAPEIGRALVDRARERGLRVAAHGNEPFPRPASHRSNMASGPRSRERRRNAPRCGATWPRTAWRWCQRSSRDRCASIGPTCCGSASKAARSRAGSMSPRRCGSVGAIRSRSSSRRRLWTGRRSNATTGATSPRCTRLA